MDSVRTQTTEYKAVAYYAHLDETAGVALRDVHGNVAFQAEATGLWTQLYDVDIPRLTLHGRCDLADAQALRDSNRVVRCSQTLGHVA